jgi:hypothetical protein
MKRLTNVALIGLVVVGLSVPVVLYSRSAMLTRLQQCYREVPTTGRQYFTSPCESMRLRMLVLAGISISEIEARLGPANDCFDADPNTGRETQDLLAAGLVVLRLAARIRWRRA